MAKLTNSTELTNMPIIFGYRLNYSHFFIQYVVENTLEERTFTPKETAEIFSTIGVIDGYEMDGDSVHILEETIEAIPGPDGEPIEKYGRLKTSFEQWAGTCHLTPNEVRWVAKYIEDNKALTVWANEMRSIPTLIKSFNN